MISIESHGINIYNFAWIIADCSVDVENMLYDYGLYPPNFSNRDTKKIIYHFIIDRICNTILNKGDYNRNIICFNVHDMDTDNEDCKDFFKKLFTKLTNNMPIRMYNNEPFKFIYDKINSGFGERTETIKTLQLIKPKCSNLKKITNLAKDNDLSALTKSFNTDNKYKNLMFC